MAQTNDLTAYYLGQEQEAITKRFCDEYGYAPVVHCRDCIYGIKDTLPGGDPCVVCDNRFVFDYCLSHEPEWFCAEGELKGGGK